MSYEIEADYDQQFMFPPTIEELIAKDDPARFIREFVEVLDIENLGMKVRRAKDGRPNYSSRLLLKIWLYGWFDKVKSIRELEKLCTRDIGMMWLSGFNSPDHNTLWRFYKENKKALKKVFRHSVKTALDNNLVGMALHAIDGTKIRADVSEKNVLRKDKLKEDLKELDGIIERYFEEIEGQDSELSYQPDKLPEELQDQKKLREKITGSLRKLEEQDTRFLNETDEDSRIMKTREGKRFSYNSQAVVDSQKGIIVGADVVQSENDNNIMNDMLDNAKSNLGKKPGNTVLDAGYFSGKELKEADDNGYNVLVNIPASSGGNTNIGTESEYHQSNFKYDEKPGIYKCPKGGTLEFQRLKFKNDRYYRVKVYHCKDYKTCALINECSKDPRGRKIEISPYRETIDKHKMKASKYENRILLKKRMTIIEPVFGFMKNVLGFRRFRVRGLANVSSQWDLVCTIVNLRKIYKEWATGRVVFS